jgi:hypothetical protein
VSREEERENAGGTHLKTNLYDFFDSVRVLSLRSIFRGVAWKGRELAPCSVHVPACSFVRLARSSEPPRPRPVPENNAPHNDDRWA